MCDKLVFDLAQEVEGTPNVFVRKDRINILDNHNQNSSNNQSIIDTSQLSNSNKYMGYREAYLAVPLTLTLCNTAVSASAGILPAGAAVPGTVFTPTASATSADYSMGLKSWFGQIIHSMTLDYNGTTTIQQTPYINMWNSFKLMTSLSYGDILSQGATIGFYYDDAKAFSFYPAGTGTATTAVSTLAAQGDYVGGCGTCNNTNNVTPTIVAGIFNSFEAGTGNAGLIERQQYINFDPDAQVGVGIAADATVKTGASPIVYSDLLPTNSVTALWKSYISAKLATTYTGGAALPTAYTAGYIQYSVMATIYLKHLHSFFNMCPLLKGVFMKMTLNLNNCSSTIVYCSTNVGAGVSAPQAVGISSVANAIGGVNPLMIASSIPSNGGSCLFPTVTTSAGATISSTYIANVSVGAVCLDNTIRSAMGVAGGGALAKSVYLYVPAYTFNPVFEQAYLSSPVKQIKYTDIYQYQVINVSGGGTSTFNNLITNGIANIKSILILPFFSSNPTASLTNIKTTIANSVNTGIRLGIPVFQSPFDPAGSGCTSPLAHISNFNVQVSGQNAIYNLEKYGFEQFNNQLYGQNAVNGGLTDGLTSGLIDRTAFDMEYCFYYVNIERMLPVEMSVPKSIQILGQNMSAKAMDYYVFIEYGVEISIDSLTGARV